MRDCPTVIIPFTNPDRVPDSWPQVVYKAMMNDILPKYGTRLPVWPLQQLLLARSHSLISHKQMRDSLEDLNILITNTT